MKFPVAVQNAGMNRLHEFLAKRVGKIKIYTYVYTGIPYHHDILKNWCCILEGGPLGPLLALP